MLINTIVNKYILWSLILLLLIVTGIKFYENKGIEKMNSLENIKRVNSYNLENTHYGFELINNKLNIWINDELMSKLDDTNSSNFEFELFYSRRLPEIMKHFIVDVKENIFLKEKNFPLDKKYKFIHIKLDNGLFDKNYQLIWVDLYLMEIKDKEWIGHVLGQSCAEDDCPDMGDEELFPLNKVIKFQ
jgi:hypothetical protein